LSKPVVLFWFAFLLLALDACKYPMVKKEEAILARVGDKYLYESEIKDLVPEGISPKDSMVLVRNYVNNWVKTTLMVQQAEKNLTDRQLNFEKQLTDYKNSLIIYKYESEWIKQNLDTIVSDEEIEAYYNDHLSNFELKENIVRVLYVIVDEESEKDLNFKKILRLPDSLMIDSLEAQCEMYAKSYYLDTATWIRFNKLQQVIPIETYNQELFLKENDLVRLHEDKEVYLVKFFDYKIKDEISPLELEHNDIRNIIINTRKMELIKKMRDDIYQSALANKEFEIYYNE
jgi:hypothetical protein